MPSKPMPVLEFLAESCEKKEIAWLSLLKNDDYHFVIEIIDAAKERPDISLLHVARSLVKKLDIDRTPETVCRTLRELIRNAE